MYYSGMATGFHYDPRYLEHETGTVFPERPERMASILDYLEQTGLIKRLVPISGRVCEREHILAVHDESYINFLEKSCQDGTKLLYGDADLPVCGKSFEIARLAAGGALNMCDAVMQRKVDNGFCLIRPPGHHAEKNRAMGFCLLNNVVISARYLQRRWGLSRVAIIDWDVHHGNGTQHILEDDPTIMVINLHQHPSTLWPGTGYVWERGHGRGEGFTLNLPFQPGATDADYQEAFSRLALPKLKEFAPQAVLISAGFDAHLYDPLAQLHLSSVGYAWMTRQLKNIAQTYASGRLISMLEGGYNLVSLAWGANAHMEVLSESTYEEKLMDIKSGMY